MPIIKDVPGGLKRVEFSRADVEDLLRQAAARVCSGEHVIVDAVHIYAELAAQPRAFVLLHDKEVVWPSPKRS